MTLKFDYCSDLHVDAWHGITRLHDPQGPRIWSGEPYASHAFYVDWEWYQQDGSKVLILAGDIANSLSDTISVVKDAADVYDHVLFVDGNHEHYQSAIEGDVDFTHEVIKDSLRMYSNVVHLNGENSLKVGNTLFVGACGWYDWQAFVDKGVSAEEAKFHWSTRNNDSRMVDYGRFKDPAALAMHHSELIRAQVLTAQTDDTVEHIVVVTHTSPREELNPWLEGNDGWNTLTPSYINTGMDRVLAVDTQKKIRHWIYGHTHERQTLDIGGVVYSNNARGYPRENEPWTMAQHVVK